MSLVNTPMDVLTRSWSDDDLRAFSAANDPAHLRSAAHRLYRSAVAGPPFPTHEAEHRAPSNNIGRLMMARTLFGLSLTARAGHSDAFRRPRLPQESDICTSLAGGCSYWRAICLLEMGLRPAAEAEMRMTSNLQRAERCQEAACTWIAISSLRLWEHDTLGAIEAADKGLEVAIETSPLAQSRRVNKKRLLMSVEVLGGKCRFPSSPEYRDQVNQEMKARQILQNLNRGSDTQSDLTEVNAAKQLFSVVVEHFSNAWPEVNREWVKWMKFVSYRIEGVLGARHRVTLTNYAYLNLFTHCCLREDDPRTAMDALQRGLSLAIDAGFPPQEISKHRQNLLQLAATLPERGRQGSHACTQIP